MIPSLDVHNRETRSFFRCFAGSQPSSVVADREQKGVEQEDAYYVLVVSPLMQLSSSARGIIAQLLGVNYMSQADPSGHHFVLLMSQSRARLSREFVAGAISLLKRTPVYTEATRAVESLKVYHNKWLR